MFIIHANIVCTNFERSFDFYTRVMGGSALEVTDDDGSDLSVPMGFIGTSGYWAAYYTGAAKDGGPTGSPRMEGEGRQDPANRQGHRLSSALLVCRKPRRKGGGLESKGVVFNAPINTAVIGRFTTRAVFFPDPDGTLLEIVQTGLLTLPRRPDMLAGRGGGRGSSGRNGCGRLVQVTRQPSTKHQGVAARRGLGRLGRSSGRGGPHRAGHDDSWSRVLLLAVDDSPIAVRSQIVRCQFSHPLVSWAATRSFPFLSLSVPVGWATYPL